MNIEIVEIGGVGRWLLDEPRIRIGQEPQCEVCLPDARYSAFTGEPLTLELVDGVIRLATIGGAYGGIFLNDNPASEGFVVRSGDILRFGVHGPELRIRMVDQEPDASAVGYTPTRVLDEPAQIAYEPTSVLPDPAATVISSPSPSSATAPVRYGYETELMRSESAARHDVPLGSGDVSSLRRSDQSTNSGRTRSRHGQERVERGQVQESRMQAAPLANTASEADSAHLHALESKLKSMQTILWANLAVLAVLLLLIFRLGQQLEQNRQEVRELRAQAQSAVGQLTPELDARLNAFDKRMDGIDAEMMRAEDRMVSRMNAEIPAMLDKYISHKLAEVKH